MVKLAISVVKNRSGNHEKSVRELILDGGIKIGKPLTAFQSALGGVPEAVGAASPAAYNPSDGD